MGWSEIIIEGPKAAATAFVAGFLAGRGKATEEVVWEHEVGMTVDSMVGRIAAVFSAERHHGLYAPAALAGEIANAIEESGIAAELALERRRELERVTFEFEAEVFSEELAAELRGLLEDLPEGTAIEDLQTGQEVHPEAGGVELYSPQHDFTFRISGRVRGDGTALLLLRRLHARDCVKLHGITLEAVPA
jgi:hypothetical protein